MVPSLGMAAGATFFSCGGALPPPLAFADASLRIHSPSLGMAAGARLKIRAVSTRDDDLTMATPGIRAAGPSRFTPGSIVAGRYRLVALLGRGGMGDVYRADDLTLDQPVALKFLPDVVAGDAAHLTQFHNE